MDVTVTAPSTDDLDALTDLWVDLARDQRQHGSHVRAAANRAAVREDMGRRIVANEVLIARVDGDVVGFVTFTTESGPYTQGAERGLVQNVYVAPAYRDESVGSELLRAAEGTLADRSVERVALEVLADNDAARRFYRRHGYDPHRVELEKELESDTL